MGSIFGFSSPGQCSSKFFHSWSDLGEAGHAWTARMIHNDPAVTRPRRRSEDELTQVPRPEILQEEQPRATLHKLVRAYQNLTKRSGALRRIEFNYPFILLSARTG